MSTPEARQPGGFLRTAGLVIAGMVIGAALFMSLYHHQLNFIIEQYQVLRTDLNQLQRENADLKKTKNQQNTINLLQVYVVPGEHTELDKLTEAELRRRINSDLRGVIIGRKISDFAENPDIYEKILVQKPYLAVMDKDYMVQNVKWMVVTQTELKIWVTVKEWKRIPMS
ncbi:hypothetical protein PAESOLCIP111_05219 [Paenibacillus solanacearum]|uniref:Sporulation membrane protein YtrI C-terminal domain-containing protein n=1 Tax=Paenibacillus solanacearum TaxID=2048548 RepID=A0A916NRD6_9BACL|nr:hypothetical protein [Paenibacillus solanacearum]CAG7646680.1 hypothetical protein PAESOLCIP111_05219 [Paenibacillus solanacearum]